eukprot:127164_1
MSAAATADLILKAYIYAAIPLFALLLIGYSIGIFLLSRKIRLNRNKNTSTSSHRAIEARRPIIIYLYIISILLIILIERPLTVYCWVSIKCTIFSKYLSPVIFAFTIYAHFYIFLVRTWILYYEINFNLAKKDIIWQKHLYLNYLSPSNKFNKSKQDWFLENKSKYGSPKWIFTKILYIPYTISCVACIAVGVSIDYHHRNWYLITNGILIILPVICILIIWKTINPIHDFYRIRAELRITLFSWIVLCLMLLINVLIFYFGFTPQYRVIEYSLSLWFIGISLTVNGLVSTAWIYHLTVNKYFEYSQEFVDFEMEKLQRTFENKSVFQRISAKVLPSSSNVIESIEPYSGIPSHANSPTPDEDNYKFINENEKSINSLKSTSNTKTKQIAEKIYSSFPLRDILVTDIGFRLFMQHMTSEYSAENLIFLVEIVRYKYALNGYKNHEMYSVATNNSIAIDSGLTWYMPLPQSLVDEVVKPPEIEQLKSVKIEINEDLTTPPHAMSVEMKVENNVMNNNGKTQTHKTDSSHLKVTNFKKKNKDRSKTKSIISNKNPLFHSNINIEHEAKQDGTLNEIQHWDEAQIAWGTLSHALMIYEKYICLDALFEINISHRLRMKMKKEFADLKKLYIENHEEIISGKLEDIVNGDRFSDNIRIFTKFPEKRKELEMIFDETACQIETLMNDSYVRFRQTQTYHRLLKQLIKDQRKKGKGNKDNFLNATGGVSK